MIKKIITTIALSIIVAGNTFAATDVTQELDSKGGTLKISNTLTINYEEGSFNETVVFNTRTVSQLEGAIDSSKFDDKGAEVLYISFKNNIGLATIPQKDISLGYNNLQNYTKPVLITYTNNKLIVINGEDNAGTFIYKLSGSIDGAFKIVDDLSGDTFNSLLDTDIDLLGNTSIDEDIEFNSASEEPVEILLSDKPQKGANDFYLIILALGLIVISISGFAIYKKS